MSPQTADPAAPERSLWRRWPFRLALLTVLLVVGLALGACGGGGETGNGGGATSAGAGATSAGGGATSAGGGATGAYGGATASGGTVGLNQLPSATEELGTTQGNP
jgi:hypothetical protein